MRQFSWLSLVAVAFLLWSCAEETKTEPVVPDVEIPVDESPPAFGEASQLQFVAVSEDALVLMWTGATDDTDVTAYHIYKDDVEMAALDGSLTSLQVHQLDANTEYSFRVEAHDAAGNVSTDGPSGTIMTGDESAPTWPEDSALNTANVTASEASLSWTAATDNVAVSGYRIYQDNLEIAAVDANTLALNVSDLDAWRNYSFRVEAEDAMGHLSNSGPTATIQTADATAPTWETDGVLVASNITPTSVDLGWSPAQDDVDVTHYQVLQDKVEVEVLESHTTWTTVNGLQPWTDYEFEIVALDAAGNASATGLTVQVQTTDETSPTWANDSVLLASDPTDTGVTLGWTAAQDNVAVTTYRLYQDNVDIGAFDGATLSTPVGDLQSGLTYLFRVEAEDAAGNLTFGGPSLSVDLSDTIAPAWPPNAECLPTEITPTSVKLGWSTATDSSEVAGYQIWSDDVLHKSVPGDQTSATVDGLTPLTDYTFSLVAVDSVGNETTDGPSVLVSTTDYPQPSWPLDAALSADNVTATTLSLNWSAPTDDQPMASFEIYQDDTKIQTVDGGQSTFLVTGLAPLTAYSFAIEAVGPTGKVSDDGPTTAATTTDYPAPLWPGDATLDASNITETSLTLSWQGLDASQPVASYAVSQGGQPLQTVDGQTTSLDVTGLSAGTTYSFGVEAIGPTNLTSANGPSASVTTLDTTPPTWPTGAELNATKVGGTTVELSWTAATDNVGIAGYRVMQDGQEAATMDGTTTTVSIEGLTVSTGYNFTVLAKDGADQWTADGPSLAVTTTSGLEPLTNEEVFEGIKAQCQGCHMSAPNTAFMASLESFNTVLVQDPHFVLPGDPDNSEVIRLMEGNGTGAWKAMPVGAGDNFKSMSDKGQTSVTIEEIRYWILVMGDN